MVEQKKKKKTRKEQEKFYKCMDVRCSSTSSSRPLSSPISVLHYAGTFCASPLEDKTWGFRYR